MSHVYVQVSTKHVPINNSEISIIQIVVLPPIRLRPHQYAT